MTIYLFCIIIFVVPVTAMLILVSLIKRERENKHEEYTEVDEYVFEIEGEKITVTRDEIYNKKSIDLDKEFEELERVEREKKLAKNVDLFDAMNMKVTDYVRGGKGNKTICSWESKKHTNATFGGIFEKVEREGIKIDRDL